MLYYIDQICENAEYLKRLLQGREEKQKITWEDLDTSHFRWKLREDILSHVRESNSDD